MLNQLFHDPITLRAAQVIGAAAFALVVAFWARRQGIHLQREAAIALARGIIQIIIVGLLLVLVLRDARWPARLCFWG